MYGPILPVIKILYIDVFHFVVWSLPHKELLKLGPKITRLDLFFWPLRAACGIPVPQPAIEPGPLAVEVQGSNHWTAGKFP